MGILKITIMEDKKEYSIEVHNQIINWTGNCDTKASIVLAFIGVIVSIAFSSNYLLSVIEEQIHNIIVYWQYNIGHFCLLPALMFISLIGFVLCIGTSCWYAIFSLKANIECSDESIIFFGKIAEYSKEDYIAKVNSMNDEGYESDKLAQIHICAKICHKKFKFYNKSIKRLFIGLLFFVCYVLLTVILNAS